MNDFSTQNRLLAWFGVGPLAEWQRNAYNTLDDWGTEGKIDWARDSTYRIIYLNVYFFQDLDELDLGGYSLNQLSKVITEIPKLKTLNVSRNKLESIYPEIGKIFSLKTLNVSGNKLKTFPSEIGTLRRLQMLSADKNQIDSLPASFDRLKNLLSLNLDENNLKSFPPEICGLKSLATLCISKNQIESLPAAIGQLRNLTHLSLASNNFKSFPPEICTITTLDYLCLSMNQIESLPAAIGQLINLEHLLMSGNKLNSLPPEIGLCRNIRWLTIRDNPNLSELPLSLGQIQGLTELDISNTNISTAFLDSLLNQCKSLRRASAIEQLTKRLHTWQLMGRANVTLNNLTDSQKITLNEWLVRLERTRDFAYSQARLARTVCDMLNSVSTHPEFKELFFVQAEANNERCEDRAAMALNEIHTSWKIICLPPDASVKSKLKIMTSAAKTLALRHELAKIIPKDEHESVEIYLYYETHFKFQSAIEGMAYGVIGKRSWINEANLLKAVNDNYFSHLIALPAFDQLVKKELKEEWERITKEALSQLTERPAGGELSDAVLKWSFKQGEIMQKKEQAWIQSCKKWYDAQVSV